MKLDFRQTYGAVGKPGAWRSSIQLAPRAAGFLRKLASSGKCSGVIAVAVEVLYAVILGTEPEIEECAGTLAGLLEFHEDTPRTLRRWAKRARLLVGMLDLQALALADAITEQRALETCEHLSQARDKKW